MEGKISTKFDRLNGASKKNCEKKECKVENEEFRFVH